MKKKKLSSKKPTKPNYNKALIDAVAKIRSMDNRLSRLIRYTEYLAGKLNTSINYSEYTARRINQIENGSSPYLIDNFDEFELKQNKKKQARPNKE